MLHLDMIGMVNWMDALKYKGLKKGQDSQEQIVVFVFVAVV